MISSVFKLSYVVSAVMPHPPILAWHQLCDNQYLCQRYGNTADTEKHHRKGVNTNSLAEQIRISLSETKSILNYK